MRKKQKKVCRILIYFEHFLNFVSAVRGCVSVSVFALLLDVPVANVRSAVGLRILH